MVFNTYICQFCKLQFHSKNLYKNHLSIIHSRERKILLNLKTGQTRIKNEQINDFEKSRKGYKSKIVFLDENKEFETNHGFHGFNSDDKGLEDSKNNLKIYEDLLANDGAKLKSYHEFELFEKNDSETIFQVDDGIMAPFEDIKESIEHLDTSEDECHPNVEDKCDFFKPGNKIMANITSVHEENNEIVIKIEENENEIDLPVAVVEPEDISNGSDDEFDLPTQFFRPNVEAQLFYSDFKPDGMAYDGLLVEHGYMSDTEILEDLEDISSFLYQ